MDLLIIGATGFVGSALARKFLGEHRIIGTARNEASAGKLRQAGVEPIIVDLADGAAVAKLAVAADATIFTPRLLDFEWEFRLVSDLLDALAGSGKSFIFTSGTGVLGKATAGDWNEDTFTEYDDFVPSAHILRRRHTEIAVIGGSNRGIRSMVVRPPVIWSEGSYGFVDRIDQSVPDTGAACYIGRGLALYSHVHIADLVELYRLALEKGIAGAVYHAVAGELNNRLLAELVAKHRGVPVRSITLQEAIALWGEYNATAILGACSRSRCPRSRRELGWAPTILDPIDSIVAKLSAR